MTITIPPAALEAAARALREEVRQRLNVVSPETWEELNPVLQNDYLNEARAAALALLENWPGMTIAKWRAYKMPDRIVLPLTTENKND
jgi:hypothetical protein